MILREKIRGQTGGGGMRLEVVGNNISLVTEEIEGEKNRTTTVV